MMGGEKYILLFSPHPSKPFEKGFEKGVRQRITRF
jgi:hypothetical protein